MNGRRRPAVCRLRWLAIVAVAAGCGVPVDSAPTPMDATPSASSSRGVGSSAVTAVFFVRGGRLDPVRRRISSANAVEQSVQALLNGVTDVEAGRGIRSSITDTVKLLRVDTSDRQSVTVDLGASLTAIGGTEQELAFAQVVYTVTEVDGGRPVRILLDGAPITVPRADGTLTGAPLSRADYRSVAPRGS